MRVTCLTLFLGRYIRPASYKYVGSPPVLQMGNAYLLSIVMLVGGIFAITQSVGLSQKRSLIASSLQAKSAYVDSIAKRITLAYALTLSQLNTPGVSSSDLALLVTSTDNQAVDGVAILNGIGEFSPRYSLKVATSASLPLGGSQSPVYRNIAVWIPPTSHTDTSVLDPTTGVFIPDAGVAYYQVVNGRELQTKAYGATLDSINMTRQMLQRYFISRRGASSDDSINYFRAVNCASVQASELPCFSSPTALSASYLSQAGLNPQTLLDGWGGNLLFANAGSTTFPYSATISVNIPYGQVGSGASRLLTATVDQP